METINKKKIKKIRNTVQKEWMGNTEEKKAKEEKVVVKENSCVFD